MHGLVIAPSVLSADFLNLNDEIEKVNHSEAGLIHFDVMDGKFVTEISYGEVVLRAIKKVAEKPLDVHLMIEEPIGNIESFVKSGADSITVHYEACSDVAATLEKIRSFGIPAALSVKPGTPVEAVFPYLDAVQMILVMTVNPGFGGQKFIEDSIGRIEALKAEIDRRGLDVDIQVDGGINKETIGRVKEAGANIFVSGSSVFKGDFDQNMCELLKKL